MAVGRDITDASLRGPDNDENPDAAPRGDSDTARLAGRNVVWRRSARRSCSRSAPSVTFGNGLVARELIVDLDDQARRLVWSARGGRLTHHNASAQVFADGEGRSRLVWIADLLPHELEGDIRAMIEQAAAVMKKTLEAS
jgi:hypothetical protein